LATSAFSDTHVLVYLWSADATKADRAEAVMAMRPVVSVQVLNEFTNTIPPTGVVARGADVGADIRTFKGKYGAAYDALDCGLRRRGPASAPFPRLCIRRCRRQHRVKTRHT
jgi:hypothetical protein